MKRFCFCLLAFWPLPFLLGQSLNGFEEHGLKVTTYASPLFPSNLKLPAELTGSSAYRGYRAGLVFLYPKSEKWYWLGGLQVSNIEWTLKSDKLEWGSPADTLPDRIRHIDDFSFLELPIGFRYYFNPGKRLKFYAKPAVHAAYLAAGRRVKTTVYRNGIVERLSMDLDFEHYRRLNLNVELAAGMEWQIYPNAALYLEPGYFSQLLQATKKPNEGRFQAMAIAGGIVFKL